jgi:hypothetical protein
MRNAPPIRDAAGAPAWANWFQQIFAALSGWNASLTATATLDFGSVAAQVRAGLTMTVNRARVGDVVALSPSTNTAGIVYTAQVTADDTVTVYAHNYSAASINPNAASFRVIVFQGA